MEKYVIARVPPLRVYGEYTRGGYDNFLSEGVYLDKPQPASQQHCYVPKGPTRSVMARSYVNDVP